jgi:hypothetical protein
MTLTSAESDFAAVSVPTHGFFYLLFLISPLINAEKVADDRGF